MQYGIMYNWGDNIKYHYLVAMHDDTTTNKATLWFAKTFLMIAVFIGDVLTLITTPFMFFIFWPINIIWCISALTTDILYSTSIMKNMGYPVKLEFYVVIAKYLGYNNIAVA